MNFADSKKQLKITPVLRGGGLGFGRTPTPAVYKGLSILYAIVHKKDNTVIAFHVTEGSTCSPWSGYGRTSV